jgi:hypothetical protein
LASDPNRGRGRVIDSILADLDARALLARLKKDQGFATTGGLRLKLHREARAIYEEAYAIAVKDGSSEAYYPGDRQRRARCFDRRLGLGTPEPPPQYLRPRFRDSCMRWQSLD